MQTIDQLLDKAKKAQGIDSDYRLAQLLEVSKNAITNYRHGKSRPDDEVALRLAVLIDRDPASVIAELHAERAKTPELRQLWMRMAHQLRHAVALVMMACGVALLLVAPNPQGAQASTLPYHENGSSSVYYVKSLRCSPGSTSGLTVRIDFAWSLATPTLPEGLGVISGRRAAIKGDCRRSS